MTSALSKPLINDVTTNPDQPLEFFKIKELQANLDKNLSYPESFIELQKKFYPSLCPLIVEKEALKVVDTCLALIKQRQWEIINYNESELRIEAVVTTNLMKFKDDVVIQVFDHGDGRSRIEMRSKSRTGKGDLGINAQRIEAFLKDAEAKLRTSVA
jgi:uncharacterized protein (DUF1499 family)